jgi:DNA-binding FrmR family transcriptional regulator
MRLLRGQGVTARDRDACSGLPCSGGACGDRHAAGVDPAIKAANLRHLRRVHGQVGGLIRMVEDDRYCSDIVMQVAAVRQSLLSVSRNLLSNHLKHCVSEAMRGPGADADAMIDELMTVLTKIAK